MEYESRVNEDKSQTKRGEDDTSSALDAFDASSVIIESNGTESKEQDTSSRSGNDAHVDDADIRPYNAEVANGEVHVHPTKEGIKSLVDEREDISENRLQGSFDLIIIENDF
ncbi:hypothetical protein Tco_1561391 [Tanacetum coccineum]